MEPCQKADSLSSSVPDPTPSKLSLPDSARAAFPEMQGFPVHPHPEGHFHILPSPDLHLVIIGTDVLKVGPGDGEEAAGKRRGPGGTEGESTGSQAGRAGGGLPSEAYFRSCPAPAGSCSPSLTATVPTSPSGSGPGERQSALS